MRALTALLGFVAVARLAAPSWAEEWPAATGASTPPEEERLPVEFHGFLLGVLSRRTTGLRPPGGEGGDIVLGEERLRLELSGATGSSEGFFLAKGDLLHDAVENRLDVDLREGYAGFTRGPLDLRLGRQIATWGVGDLLFINDVFPKDWESFFSGRPMDYLKLGVDGVRTQLSTKVVNAEAWAIPFFKGDRLPSPERFFLFDPASGVSDQREEKPEVNYINPELALRLYRQLGGVDASLYVYRGFWRTPGVRLDDPVVPTRATQFFPKLSVYGASVQRSLLSGVLSFEAGYYGSREDPYGGDPTVPNSQWRFLAGYQRQLWQDFTVGVQGYGEIMGNCRAYRDSLLAGSPRQDQFRGVISLRLTQLLSYQTWRLVLFVAHSPTDGDYFIRPEVSYKATDSLSAIVGANVFGGQEETTYFGQFGSSDNVFANLRFDF